MPISGSTQDGESGAKIRLRLQDIAWREVGDEVVVLEVESGTYLNLNGSARKLWEALAEGADVEQLTALLVEQYDIAPEQAAADTQSFLADLRRRSLVEPAA